MFQPPEASCLSKSMPMRDIERNAGQLQMFGLQEARQANAQSRQVAFLGALNEQAPNQSQELASMSQQAHGRGQFRKAGEVHAKFWFLPRWLVLLCRSPCLCSIHTTAQSQHRPRNVCEFAPLSFSRIGTKLRCMFVSLDTKGKSPSSDQEPQQLPAEVHPVFGRDQHKTRRFAS